MSAQLPATTGPYTFFMVRGDAMDARRAEAVFRLNHLTFADEIPQHPVHADARLVDRFHDENTYVLCEWGGELVGMLALRCSRPFSLDIKLPDLNRYVSALHLGERLCEIRLLAVTPEHRRSAVFAGLMRQAARYCAREGCDAALISGTVRQARLYRHLGFVPFGPLVGSGDAPYQPMYLTWDRYNTRRVRLLPGPVTVAPPVREAFAGEPLSHRCAGFATMLAGVQTGLTARTGATHAAVLLGSGTLANDVIAAQLRYEPGPGLILTNGEFGERLVRQASRMSLSFTTLPSAWGQAWNLEEVADTVRQTGARWVWAVHTETSTGMCNPVIRLANICARTNAKLCLDCVSSIGADAVDVRGVYLASGVSGKALGAYTGLSFVLYHHCPPSRPDCPAYLDLGLYHAAMQGDGETGGVPFSQSSPLVAALHAALQSRGLEADALTIRRARMQRLRAHLCETLEPVGVSLVTTSDEDASAGIVSLQLPPSVPAARVALLLLADGYEVAYQSGYLRNRNWLQIALMGVVPARALRRLPDALHRAVCEAARCGNGNAARGTST